MDGEAEALHRQLHHYGCAVQTPARDIALVDNRGIRGPGRFIERTIMTKSIWRVGAVSVYEDGAVVVLGAPGDES